MEVEQSNRQISVRLKHGNAKFTGYELTEDGLKSKCEPNNHYLLDSVVPETTKQSDFCNKIVQHCAGNQFTGENGTIMVYGAPKTGKTYTMWGDCGLAITGRSGLVPRYLDHLFTRITSRKYRISMKLLKVCGDKIIDLFSTNTVGPTAYQDLKVVSSFLTGYYEVLGANELTVNSFADAMCHLNAAREHERSMRAQDNEKYRKVHTVLTVYLCKKRSKSEFSECSRLSFVELAGCVDTIEPDEEHNNSEHPTRNAKIYPEYKTSNLVKLLWDGLKVDSYVHMIVTVSLDASNYRTTNGILEQAIAAMRTSRNTCDDNHRAKSPDIALNGSVYTPFTDFLNGLELSKEFFDACIDYEQIFTALCSEVQAEILYETRDNELSSDEWDKKVTFTNQELDAIELPRLRQDIHQCLVKVFQRYKEEVESIICSLGSIPHTHQDEVKWHRRSQWITFPKLNTHQLVQYVCFSLHQQISEFRRFHTACVPIPGNPASTKVHELFGQLKDIEETLTTLFSYYKHSYCKLLRVREIIKAERHNSNRVTGAAELDIKIELEELTCIKNQCECQKNINEQDRCTVSTETWECASAFRVPSIAPAPSSPVITNQPDLMAETNARINTLDPEWEPLYSRSFQVSNQHLYQINNDVQPPKMKRKRSLHAYEFEVDSGSTPRPQKSIHRPSLFLHSSPNLHKHC